MALRFTFETKTHLFTIKEVSNDSLSPISIDKCEKDEQEQEKREQEKEKEHK